MIQDYLKAGYPALYIITQDIYRAQRKLPEELSGWRVLFWDCCIGTHDISLRQVDEVLDPVDAINSLNNMRDTVLIFHNLHLFINQDNPNPVLVQSIQNGVKLWKGLGSSLITISPDYRLCRELDKLFAVVDYPLPDSQELFDLQCAIAPKNIRPNRKAAYSGALGLTEFEAENSYAMSLVKKGYFSTQEVSKAKAQILKKAGLLELHRPAKLSELGGLASLKGYILNRSKAITSDDPGLPRPKAFLLVGVPGTGKSLACKAVASILNWQLVRLDIGALKGSLVGESERKIRQATKIIDNMQNLVVWADEIEKQFAGVTSGISDGGSSAGMFSHFLTWMQETTSRLLIVATANNIQQLPPEFLRAGRFDATFFVDLPTYSERQHIIRIMNKKYKVQIPQEFAEKLSGYSGAEIEQLAKDSLYDGLDEAYNNIVPLSRTMKEDIDALRRWARTRARFANSREDPVGCHTRKISTNRKGG
jgi:hypothetical protein